MIIIYQSSDKMKTKTEKILLVLKVLAWLALGGYAVQCGSQVISFSVSLYNPEAAKRIYGTSLSLHPLYLHNRQYFIYIMSFLIALSAMHSYVWYRVTGMLTRLNLQEPFSRRIARTLEEIGNSIAWDLDCECHSSTIRCLDREGQWN